MSGLTYDGYAVPVHELHEHFTFDGSPETWYRLKFVHSASRETKSSSAHFRHRYSAGRRNWSDYQCGFVAYSAGTVLIHLDASDPAEIDDIPRYSHDVGQIHSLPFVHATEIHCHQECRHLIVRNTA